MSERRILSIVENITLIFEKQFLVSARGLASFVGKIVSAGSVFSNIARLMTRYCSISIVAVEDWDSVFLLADSDASGTCCGSHLDFNGEKVCHREWDFQESQKSSTRRELMAIKFALQSFLPLLKGTYVKWFSDSQTALQNYFRRQYAIRFACYCIADFPVMR